MSLSIIIPSLGRPTLARTLASFVGSLEPGDEAIIVADERGDVEQARRIWSETSSEGSVVFATQEGGEYGNAQRERGMAMARGTHLGFVDDDDVYAPEALGLFREHACDRPVIFRMRMPDGSLIWRDHEIRYANYGTPMGLWPNVPGLGKWIPHVAGSGQDYVFARDSCEALGEPVWVDRVVAFVRP